MSQDSRTEMLLGKKAMQRLKSSSVIVFGIGGVGSYVTEALARGGIGSLALCDNDKVCLSNINRQLIATHSVIGKYKVQIMRDRILDINPNCRVETFQFFYGPDTADLINLSKYSYIVDAIDTVTSKIMLIEKAKESGIPIISCMGAGNKLDPARFEVADIYETSVCPLAKVMRKELRAREIADLKVVYSKETPLPLRDTPSTGKSNCCSATDSGDGSRKRHIPGSVSFVPPAAGLIIAGEVIKDLLKQL